MIDDSVNQFLGGLFNNSDKPFHEAGNTLQKYLGEGREVQNPFMNMGKQAIPQFQDWLKGMKDPSGFINTLMNKYQESPWAKFQQDQSARRFGNAGSATGLTGSTPLASFEQQNMHDISSQDMNTWLSHVLGINTEYGGGLQNEITGGQNAANSITDLLKSMGTDMAGLAGSEEYAKNKDRNDTWGGLFNTGKDLLSMFAGG